jgi:preprotein translocase SecF subunit
MSFALVKYMPQSTDIPFVRVRMIAMAFSVLLVLGSLVAFGLVGMNFGIDFRGGIQVEIQTEDTPDIESIRSVVDSLDLGDVKIQRIGSDNEVLITTEIQTVDEEDLDTDADAEGLQHDALLSLQNGLIAGMANLQFAEAVPGVVVFTADTAVDIDRLATRLLGDGIAGVNVRAGESALEAIVEYADDTVEGGSPVIRQQVIDTINLDQSGVTIRGGDVVGPQVSGELVVKGITAIGVALILMLIYIWFRFEWQYSVGAIVALTHDVVATIGLFAVTQMEFNLSTIAAILTIVGYSMNDTVVVYDRIRENLRKYKKKPLADVLNMSINDTLSRTILTSLTTLVALISLWLIGGEALKGFAFAMIWGVLIGTYSSIFVAAPLLLVTKVKRESSSA